MALGASTYKHGRCPCWDRRGPVTERSNPTRHKVESRWPDATQSPSLNTVNAPATQSMPGAMPRARASLPAASTIEVPALYRLEKLDICLTVGCATVPEIASRPWHPSWIVPATRWRPSFATSGRPTLRVVPSPASGRMQDAVLATHCVRGLLSTTRRKRSAPGTREGVERRKAHPTRCPRDFALALSPFSAFRAQLRALSERARLPPLCCCARPRERRLLRAGVLFL